MPDVFGAKLAAAALLAAASLQSPAPAAHPFPVRPPAPSYGAHCPDGGGRAIGAPVGKGAYIRQVLQLAGLEDRRVVGYVYSGSDGQDYIDLTPADPHERVRAVRAGDLPRRGAIMRYCFSDAWTRPWGWTK